MPTPFSQANRKLRISTPLPADAVLIEKLTGTEGISELFQFELDLFLQPSKLEDTYGASSNHYLAFDKLLGQPITVTIDGVAGCPARFVNGIIARISEGIPLQGTGGVPLIRCSALLVPTFWLLTCRSFSRVFEDITVPQVLDKYFRELWGLANQPALQRGSATATDAYERRPMCVQYQESDYDFLCRLMEEEGIRFYFTHLGTQHTLVYSDQPLTHPDLSAPATLQYTTVIGALQNQPRITDWKKSQVIEPMEHQVRDFHLQLSQNSLSYSKSLPAQVQTGPIAGQKVLMPHLNKLQVLDPGAGFAQRFDAVNPNGAATDGDPVRKLDSVFTAGDRTAEIRAQRAACRSLTLEGAGNAAHFLPGHLFDFDGLDIAKGRYLLTWVKHFADQTGTYSSSGEVSLTYHNEFRCSPKDLPCRPPVASRAEPILYPITATVVQTGSAATPLPKVDCDKYGRVKVHFHWNSDQATCWLPVTQAWAGNRTGSFYIPRVGSEVVVSFLDGRRDRPIITGCVHDDQNLPPFWDPSTQKVPPSVTGVRTRTLAGADSDFSMISIDDKKGAELLSIQANRDSQTYTKNDSKNTVDHDLNILVGHNARFHVGNDYGIDVDRNASNDVAGNQTEVVGYDGWFKSIGFIPRNAVYTYGNHFVLSAPLHTDINFCTHGYILVDPADWFVNKVIPGSWVWTRRILTSAGGKTDVLYGNETRIMYGSLAKSFCRGQMMVSVLKFRGTETSLMILTAIHLASLGLTILLPLIKAKSSGNAASHLGVAADIASLVVTISQTALKVVEKMTRMASIQAALGIPATEVASLGVLLASVDGQLNLHGANVAKGLAAYMKKLAFSEAGNLHHEIEDTYGIQCKQLQVVASGDIAITTPRNAIRTTATKITTASKVHTISSSSLELRAYPSTITMSPGGIVMEAGPTSKIDMEPDKITLTCGASTLEIGVAQINRLSQMLQDHGVAVNAAP